MWWWEIQICTQIFHRGTCHVISRMRNVDLHCDNFRSFNISKSKRVIDRDVGVVVGQVSELVGFVVRYCTLAHFR